MKTLLKLKENIKVFYGKHNRYIDAVIRFVFALTVFLTILRNAGYNTVLSTPYLAIAMALICAFLPVYMVTILGSVLIVIEFISVGVEIGIVALILLFLMLLLYYIFRAGDSWIMMFVMTLCLLNLPPVVLPLGLLFTPIETLVICFGVILYGLLAVVRKDISLLSSQSSTLSLTGRINLLLTDLFSNEKFLLLLIVLLIASLLVVLLKRSRANYASLIGIMVGDFVFLAAYLLGAYFLDITINGWTVFIGMALNILLSFVFINFVLGCDYKRTEEVQFEDENYYYYVKAVPKTAIAIQDRHVEKITDPNKMYQGSEEMDTDKVFIGHADKKEDTGVK